MPATITSQSKSQLIDVMVDRAMFFRPTSISMIAVSPVIRSHWRYIWQFNDFHTGQPHNGDFQRISIFNSIKTPFLLICYASLSADFVKAFTVLLYKVQLPNISLFVQRLVKLDSMHHDGLLEMLIFLLLLFFMKRYILYISFFQVCNKTAIQCN